MVSYRDKKNLFVLALCQTLFNTTRALVFTTSPIIAYAITPVKALATLPISLSLVGTMIAAIPASMLMARVGRRIGFFIGALIGTLGSGLALGGLAAESFVLFSLGALFIGFFYGFANHYRFAAADAAPESFKAKAISLVLAGGVLAAFIGPELAKFGRELIGGKEFLGSYVILIVLTVLAALIVMAIDIPKLSRAEKTATGRPMAVIARQPAFIAAVTTAMLGYATMAMMMTATPLAMLGHGHVFNDAAFVIEWHAFAMFAPGFFTGSLIRRFGTLTVISSGLALQLVSVFVALSGQDLIHFWIALFLLGLGWNFTFTGGTALVTEIHSPAERAKVQGVNDFLVFSAVAVSSLTSGALYHFFGWIWVSLAALPLIGIAGLAALWLAIAGRDKAEGTAPAE